MTKQLNYFVHHVYFWFKKPASKRDKARFEAALKVLVTHPTHLNFIEDCSDLWEKVVVYDSVSI